MMGNLALYFISCSLIHPRCQSDVTKARAVHAFNKYLYHERYGPHKSHNSLPWRAQSHDSLALSAESSERGAPMPWLRRLLKGDSQPRD